MADIKPIGIDQTTGQQREVGSADNLSGNIGNEITLKITNVGDYSGNLQNNVQILFPWDDSYELLLNEPASNFSSGALSGCAWSPNGEFLVVTKTAGDLVHIYQRTATTFTLLSDPTTTPNSTQAPSWSPDGRFLSVGGSSARSLMIYERDGSTFTKLSDPSSIPTSGTVYEAAFSSNGELMAATPVTAGDWLVYRREDTTFTLLAAPSSAPQAAQNGVGWSPDGRFLAFTSTSGGRRLHIYERTGLNEFTLLEEPSSGDLPSDGRSVSWSQTGRFLAIGEDSASGTPSTFVKFYERDDNVFYEIAAPASLPGTSGHDITWFPDDKFVAITHFTTPFIQIYERDGTTFTLLDDPASLPPTGLSGFPAWSPDGQFLALAQQGTGGLYVYQTGLDMPDSGVITTVRQHP